MEQLITIHEKNGSRAVSARELHQFLESKRDFSNWIKDKIQKYNFIEGVDYVTFAKIVERAKRIEYALTLDMAKELSMLEANLKGQQARRYFIECENRLRSLAAVPETFAQALQLAADQAKKIEQQGAELQAMKPRAKAADILLLSDDSLTIGEFAKTLGTGQNRFFELLRNDGYLIKEGSKQNLPYQRYLDAGYFKVREVTKTADNKIKVFRQTQITTKGQVYFANRYTI